MWTIKDLETLVNKRLSKKRASHVFAVRDCAMQLCALYGGDPLHVEAAALLHDITKEESKDKQLQTIKKSGIIVDNLFLSSPQLFHALTGSLFVKNVLGIGQKEIINAVRYHTTGRKGMSTTEKIVYLADAISADRHYKGVQEFRKLSTQSLDLAIFAVLKHTLRYLVKDGAMIPRDTIEAYNELAQLCRHAD